jgi:hypothetical protein
MTGSQTPPPTLGAPPPQPRGSPSPPTQTVPAHLEDGGDAE